MGNHQAAGFMLNLGKVLIRGGGALRCYASCAGVLGHWHGFGPQQTVGKGREEDFAGSEWEGFFFGAHMFFPREMAVTTTAEF